MICVANDGQRDSERGPDTPVWIWQRTWEFSKLLDLYRAKRPRKVLEIGVYTGGSLYHWLRNAEPGTLVYGIDPAPAELPLGEWCPKGVEVRIDMRAAEAAATDVEALGPWDWLFIDGDHSQNAVRADWDRYHKLVAPGGVICLHDIVATADASIDVAPVWEDIQRRGYVTQELVADPAEEWGGIGIVYL